MNNEANSKLFIFHVSMKAEWYERPIIITARSAAEAESELENYLAEYDWGAYDESTCETYLGESDYG